MERYLKPSSNRSRPPRSAGRSSELEYSDFPPIRKLDSSSPAPAVAIRSQDYSQPLHISSEEEPFRLPLRRCRPSDKGLGRDNLVNLGLGGAAVVPAAGRVVNLKVMPILNQSL